MGIKTKKKPVRLTVLPVNFFLLELVADKNIKRGHIFVYDFASRAASHEMSSDSQTSKS